MIPIDNFIEDAVRKLKKMKPLNCLDIRTYKRDRSVVIEKMDIIYMKMVLKKKNLKIYLLMS